MIRSMPPLWNSLASWMWFLLLVSFGFESFNILQDINCLCLRFVPTCLTIHPHKKRMLYFRLPFFCKPGLPGIRMILDYFGIYFSSVCDSNVFRLGLDGLDAMNYRFVAGWICMNKICSLLLLFMHVFVLPGSSDCLRTLFYSEPPGRNMSMWYSTVTVMFWTGKQSAWGADRIR